MKNYTLRTIDIKGNIVDESPLTLSGGGMLIQILPDVTLESAQILHNNLKDSLTNGKDILTFLHGTELKILEIE